MPNTSRLYHCCRCHAQVIICSHCDRGQRYCANGCSAEARDSSKKRAAKKYQLSRVGRFKNAERQARFRERQKQKVTHQGSSAATSHVVLNPRVEQPEKNNNPPQTGDVLFCHHCGNACGSFLRHDFIHRSRFKRLFRCR